eukprot:SAG31_NODE_6849_length_1870_cov_1.849802_2_plen_222_part_00
MASAGIARGPLPSLVLYGAAGFRSGRVVWALEELGLPYEHRAIGSRTGETQTPEFLEINPRGKIPALVVDGDLYLAESAAINTYLCDRYGGDLGLIPSPGSAERATHDMWCYFAATELDSQGLYIHRKHDELREIYGAAPSAVRRAGSVHDLHIISCCVNFFICVSGDRCKNLLSEALSSGRGAAKSASVYQRWNLQHSGCYGDSYCPLGQDYRLDLRYAP